MIAPTKTPCPNMLGVRDAASTVGLTYGALRRLCIQGKVVHIRVGNKILVNFDKLCEYLNGESK